MVRHGAIDGAAVPAPSYQVGVESAEDARITIDLPSTPDDVRLRVQSVRRLSDAGFVPGLTGLAVTVLGAAGLAGGAFLCLEAAAETGDSDAAEQSRWVSYGLGGAMGALSSLAVTFGLSQVCVCMKKRRDAANEISTLSAQVQFAAGRGDGTTQGRYDRA